MRGVVKRTAALIDMGYTVYWMGDLNADPVSSPNDRRSVNLRNWLRVLDMELLLDLDEGGNKPGDGTVWSSCGPYAAMGDAEGWASHGRWDYWAEGGEKGDDNSQWRALQGFRSSLSGRGVCQDRG